MNDALENRWDSRKNITMLSRVRILRLILMIKWRNHKARKYKIELRHFILEGRISEKNLNFVFLMHWLARDYLKSLLTSFKQRLLRTWFIYFLFCFKALASLHIQWKECWRWVSSQIFIALAKNTLANLGLHRKNVYTISLSWKFKLFLKYYSC